MSFDEKEAEDERMHFPWLLVTSIQTKTSHDDNPITLDLDIFQIILERFSVAWDLLVAEDNDCKFHTQFRQAKIDNTMVGL